jgi:hypothetical protein
MSIQSIASELESDGVHNHVVIAKDSKVDMWEKRLASRVGKPATGKHFSIGQHVGGYRLELVEDKNGGAADVSPRLPPKQFETWLLAFIGGYEFAKTGRI